MNTEHIIFYPHKKYNTKKEITNKLKNKNYIQYGYIKIRDLDKWLNNEIVSVKMGMLTPSKKSYRDLTILESVIKRIKEQDTTALFDDDDELVPIYVFISTETDIEWRDYLFTKGFVPSRANANREGVKIKKSDIDLHYGEHYGYNTKEVLSEKEIKVKENKQYFENVLGYGVGTYEKYRIMQEERMLEAKANEDFVDLTLNEKTLEINGYKKIAKSDFLVCCVGFCVCLAFLIVALATSIVFLGLIASGLGLFYFCALPSAWENKDDFDVEPICFSIKKEND